MTGNAETHNRWQGSRLRIAAWAIAALFLLLPLVAMQYTDEVNWTVGDFVFAGLLLFGSLSIYEIAVRMTDDALYRAGVGVALIAALLLVWVNAAVGIIGAADNDANMLYLGVLGVGILGALIARFQPHGMARALSATALAQALVGVIALIAAGLDSTGPIQSSDIIILTTFFVALWVGSAFLFRKAAAEDPPVANTGAES